MCCKTVVSPLDLEIAAMVLQIGMFRPTQEVGEGEIPKFWRRDIPEEFAAVTVTLSGSTFEAGITPSISNYIHHHGKRITAGVYFEICAKYAEKVGGRVEQRATVQGCKDSQAPQTLVVADYPAMPLQWERVCHGFQEVILGEDDEAIATG